MADRLRALVVSYNFPPVGGAGVQRVSKLVKYLPAHGVRPAVLTVANPSVPVLDESLAKDLPAEVEVVRARTFEPGYAAKKAAWAAAAARDGTQAAGAAPGLKRRLVKRASDLARQLLVPDPQILWQPAAQAALAARLVGRRDDVVLVSGPPFSQFLLAVTTKLARRTGIVVDYRDEWSTYRTTYEMMGSSLGARVSDVVEPLVLRRADAVTTATEEFRENLLLRFPFLDPRRVHAIPNGYDLDDFPAERPAPPSDRFVVTYAGTVFKLTSAQGLLGAIRRLHERAPELAKRLEVRFIGRIVETEQAFFDGTEALGVKRLGYVPHAEVTRALAESHLALCLLDDVPGVERIYPAKIFELMVLGRPILTLAPAGALTRLVERHALGAILPPRDEAAIAAHLEGLLRRFTEGAYEPTLRATGIERYDRKALAGEFAAVLAAAAARARA